jgi:hypothetical protein
VKAPGSHEFLAKLGTGLIWPCPSPRTMGGELGAHKIILLDEIASQARRGISFHSIATQPLAPGLDCHQFQVPQPSAEQQVLQPSAGEHSRHCRCQTASLTVSEPSRAS